MDLVEKEPREYAGHIQETQARQGEWGFREAQAVNSSGNVIAAGYLDNGFPAPRLDFAVAKMAACGEQLW
jgi:hypothetical protein